MGSTPPAAPVCLRLRGLSFASAFSEHSQARRSCTDTW